MDRRELLKGLYALALARCATSEALTSKKAKAATPTTLIIYLEGPFAIVLHTQARDRIQLFTPMGANHWFYCNGNKEDETQPHPVKLVRDDALFSNPNPDLGDPNIGPFHWNSVQDPSSYKDLITMNLPSPDRIRTYHSGMVYASAIFKSKRTAPIPSAHTLEYTITDASASFMLHDGVMADKIPGKFGSILFFVLQAGLPVIAGVEPDDDGSKATAFHNAGMLPRFPDLLYDADKQIDSIAQSPATRSHAKRLPAAVKAMVSTAVECKASGFLITTNP